jgi:hypothetical protein
MDLHVTVFILANNNESKSHAHASWALAHELNWILLLNCNCSYTIIAYFQPVRVYLLAQLKKVKSHICRRIACFDLGAKTDCQNTDTHTFRKRKRCINIKIERFVGLEVSNGKVGCMRSTWNALLYVLRPPQADPEMTPLLWQPASEGSRGKPGICPPPLNF